MVRPTFNLSYHVSLTQIQWVASTSCKACAGGRLYDPSTSLDTGQSFEINYIAGRAAGPIVWDKVSVGGYTLEHQALGMTDLLQSSYSIFIMIPQLPLTKSRMSRWMHLAASLGLHCLSIPL